MLCLMFSLKLQAAPVFPDLSRDHAVLRRDAPIRDWGQGDAGEKISVTLPETTQGFRTPKGLFTQA